MALLVFGSLAFEPFEVVLVAPDEVAPALPPAVPPEPAELDSVAEEGVDDVDELSEAADAAAGSLAPSPAAEPDRESVR